MPPHLIPLEAGARLRPSPRAQEALSRQHLAQALRGAVAGEVRFDAGSRALYATDASNYRQPPIGVVIPKTAADVIQTVAVCRRFGAPILSRGGGTSLCGQCCNTAVVIDFSKYLNRIVDIDPVRKLARVQPGVVLDDLRAAAGRHGLTFAPDPATHTHNTLGGMIGNNSCGPHSVMGGKTVENVVSLEVLTYDGTCMTLGETSNDAYAALVAAGGRPAEIASALRALRDRHAERIRSGMPHIPRRVSGYNLDALLPENGFHLAQALVGSEGTCAVVLEATVRLVDDPPCRALLVLGYEDVYQAGDDVPRVMQCRPIALEGIDQGLVRDMQAIGLRTEDLALLPKGGGWLLVEFGGATAAEAEAHAKHAVQTLQRGTSAPAAKLYTEPGEQGRLWKIRESGLGATAHVPNQPVTWEGWEDSAVPPDRLGDYLRALRQLLDRYGYACDLYGHFGQGCVHTRIDFDLETAEGIDTYKRFIREAAQLVVALGGSISGEHGDGQSKAELLPILFGRDLMEAFRAFKSIWDPENKMNPGKVIDAAAVDEHLRLGVQYDPPQLSTEFRYGRDGGSFSRAMLRCVGVGECRKSHGVMCPSYMATGEEMHSTRGRARLLFEAMQGMEGAPDARLLTRGWKEPAVKEALDLCLSCKGCRSECPVKVDMATYKAEFMSHYYAGRIRPLAAYAFGMIDTWSRLASHAPELANFFTQSRPWAALAKRMIGIAAQRRITPFARQSFDRWFCRRPPVSGNDRMPVILWPDTFNNYFHPEVALAAVRVLEATGCSVRLPPIPLCCGRPLYEFGMMDRARRYLTRAVQALAPALRAGTPIVGLEPACVSVFKTELPDLLGPDGHAKRLSGQVQLLTDFLDRHAPSFPFRRLQRDALVHAHCHHKTVLGTDAQGRILQRVLHGLHEPEQGCCGMAGAFGMQRDKYEVSMRCAERALLPAVRSAASDTLIVADGFSCREQIVQSTERSVFHVSQVLEMALARESSGNF